VTLYFLPTYSPYLNPIELVFGFVKNYLRNNSHHDNLLISIIDAFGRVGSEEVMKFYEFCAQLARAKKNTSKRNCLRKNIKN